MRRTDQIEEQLNTLIYKRTHTDDPNMSGEFGCSDCMGRVRGYSFDAVIGVGGKCPDHGSEDIARKINWIGIGSFRNHDDPRGVKGPVVTFEHFVLWEETGPDLKEYAPKLFRYMFEDQHVRYVLSRSRVFTSEMRKEVQNILALAETFQPNKPSRVFEKKSLTNCRC